MECVWFGMVLLTVWTDAQEDVCQVYAGAGGEGGACLTSTSALSVGAVIRYLRGVVLRCSGLLGLDWTDRWICPSMDGGFGVVRERLHEGPMLLCLAVFEYLACMALLGSGSAFGGLRCCLLHLQGAYLGSCFS